MKITLTKEIDAAGIIWWRVRLFDGTNLPGNSYPFTSEEMAKELFEKMKVTAALARPEIIIESVEVEPNDMNMFQQTFDEFKLMNQ